jgi:NAD+ diphosphatase
LIATPPFFIPLAAAQHAPQALTFAFRGNEILVREPELALPDAAAAAALGVDESRLLPVGLYQGAYCCATWLEPGAAPAEGYAFRGLRSLFGRMDEPLLAVAGRAFQIADWARTHRYCGACGKPMQRTAGERAMKCVCGQVAYPRISPAMMVLVTRGRDLLLARANRFPGAMYSALAGFVEPGETIEDCVHREVHEEVGIDVDDLHYFASQSWSFPHSLMIAYTARYAGGELRPDPGEIAEARWFAADALPDLPTPLSIARLLIETTAARLRSAPGVTPVG